MRHIFLPFIALVVSLITLFTVLNNNASLSKDKSKNDRGIQQVKQQYQDISPEEAKKRLDTEKGIILVDVRTKEEYAEKHIPGSTLIPVEVIEKEAINKLKDKDSTIFVYCRSGNRSTSASKILASLGYTRVSNMGGIIDWKYETESGDFK